MGFFAEASGRTETAIGREHQAGHTKKSRAISPRLCADGLWGMLLHVVATSHSFYATLAVNNALLSGVEGVALAANLDSQSWPGSTSLKHVAARAGDGGGVKVGMYICFHNLIS